MKESLFAEITHKWLPAMNRVTERINGKEGAPVYLHKDMLRPEFSIDQTYSTANVDTTFVAADFVDPNSPLPVKRRDSIETSNGKLPVSGMKLVLNSKEINDIQLMIARKIATEEVVRKVMNDAIRCTSGMQEKMEADFLEGLSNGAVGVLDHDNGRMVRIDYGYPSKNQFGAVVAWGKEGYEPISDLVRVLSVASGTSYIMLSDTAYNLMRRSREARELVANQDGVTVVETSRLPIPTKSRFNAAMKDEYGVDFIVVDRTVVREANGVRTKVKPWNGDKVVFLQSNKVGALVYGTLPEEAADIAGVAKSKPLPYALLRKYSTIDPYTEVTDIKGIVAPIIEGANNIYVLDIAAAHELDTNAEASDGDDTKLTVAGKAYDKAKLVKAYNAKMGTKLPANIGDEKLLGKINELSDEDEAAVLAEAGE